MGTQKSTRCASCKKPKRDCVLPCKNAVSAFTEDERFAQWIATVFKNVERESDRRDPKRKRPGGIVAKLDNVSRNLAEIHIALTGRWP